MNKKVIDIRQARIDRIKKQVKNGTYVISTTKVAKSMKRWYLK